MREHTHTQRERQTLHLASIAERRQQRKYRRSHVHIRIHHIHKTNPISSVRATVRSGVHLEATCRGAPWQRSNMTDEASRPPTFRSMDALVLVSSSLCVLLEMCTAPEARLYIESCNSCVCV